MIDRESRLQNWRFVYKYTLFNSQTSISPYKLAFRITTQPSRITTQPNSEKDYILEIKTDEITLLNSEKAKALVEKSSEYWYNPSWYIVTITE